ncbi:hypothetical protein Sjap_001204 [Stephania japonica]|uniref:Fatty acyl-CoA reductase n=1 Tax=Stephania japonica TaxID=461633 RepID=A0AAP0KL99_9MAGN
MELNGIAEFLEHKSILVTGSTGFLAKILVEKVLRTQPNVKRLYLLLRAADAKLAEQRLQKEVLEKDVFKVLKEKYGPKSAFNSFISNKLVAVAGDISLENLCVEDTNLRDLLFKEVDIIINTAATTKFDERYDVALGINTFGPKHVLDFAKNCSKLEMFLHVSTAYVCGETSEVVQEKPFKLGETINGTLGLDIEEELNLMNQKLNELRALNVNIEAEKAAMEELGLKRTIDSLTAVYGKGKLTFFLGNPDSILDVIPGDMVVNAMIVAMVAHANQPSQFVYQLGTSFENPLKLSTFKSFDVANLERLRMALDENEFEAKAFHCDPKCIDWEDYFMNIHFPGLVKHVF